MQWKDEKDKLGKEITEMLYDAGMIRTWYKDKAEGWTLISGLWSPLYISLRPLGSHPEILKKVGYAMGRIIKEECKNVNRVVGIATAGVPIATAISLEANIPMAYTRKIEGVKNVEDFRSKITEYGQHDLIEGEFNNGDQVILVDDLVTMLSSKLVAIEQFKAEMIRRKTTASCDSVIVLLDREQGAEKLAETNQLRLFSLIPFKSKALNWLKNKFSKIEYDVLTDYLANTDKYQNKTLQEDLKSKAIKK
jgi:orotate phosphoribosyltransferase